MSEGTAAEPPNGTPGRRALGAMESAVRRARERTDATTLTRPPPEATPPTAYAPSAVPPPPPPPAPRPWTGTMPPRSGPPRSAQHEHWLAISVAVVAVLVVAAGIALAVSSGGGGGPQIAAPPPSTTPSLVHGAHPPAARHPGRVGSDHGSHASRTSTSAPPSAGPAGGPPVISSITPKSGAAGQGIQIAGSNFLSSDGQIVATFNGQVAPTSCPAQNTCTVTVPPMTGAPSAQIVITTAGGTSNAVTFTYS
jgi:hypothetical protein